MDASRDSGKSNNTLTDWTNNLFERVNHSTNFEDAINTSDETNFAIKRTNQLEANVSKVIENTKRDQISNTFSKIYLKPAMTTPKFKMDQRDNGFVESFSNSSAEVTPAGTPQSSPYSLRKMLDINKIGNNANNSDNEQKKVSNNPKRWFYTGFFGSEDKAEVGRTLPKNPSFKNLCISNFDINAVGPTSW